MKIAIIFIGLIVQVNQPMSFDNTAVLLFSPQHEARLSIPFQSILNPDEWLKSQPRNGSDVEIDLKGVTVRVKGTRGVLSGLQKTLTSGTLGLNSVASDCRLRPEVRNRQIVPDKVVAYVDFRGGRVMPESYLPFQVSFTGNKKDAHCTVCGVRYEADLHRSYATVVFKKMVTQPDGSQVQEIHEIKVAGGKITDAGGLPEILVSNRPPHLMNHHLDTAFNVYLDGCMSTHHIQVAVTDQTCTETKLCTALPKPPGPAFPGDDCTIVRHP